MVGGMNPQAEKADHCKTAVYDLDDDIVRYCPPYLRGKRKKGLRLLYVVQQWLAIQERHERDEMSLTKGGLRDG